MSIANYIIVGSGISALVASIKNRKTLVLSKISKISKKNILKTYNLYEYNNYGGNTNVWGAYVNLGLLNKLKKNKKFSFFLKNNVFFNFKKITSDKRFKNVGYIQDNKTKKIFRINNKKFYKNFKNFNLKKIIINKRFIEIYSETFSYKVKKLNLCIGNLGLLKILYKSKLIKNDDIISYEDGSVKYNLNFNHNKNNYYIPMSIKQMLQKLFLRSFSYMEGDNNNNFFVQFFPKKYKKFSFKVNDLIESNSNYHRGLISNHIANLRINNCPINKYIKNKSPNIVVNCTGNIKKYIAGSISQHVIYHAFKNS